MAKAAKAKSDEGKITFRKDSKEFRKLLKLLKDGKIKADEQPASVRSRFSDIFGKYKPGQFRSQFNNAKGMVGVHVAKKTTKDDDSDDSDDDEEEEPTEVEEEETTELVSGKGELFHMMRQVAPTADSPLAWTPKKIVGQYVNADGIRCVVILVALTGGTATIDNSDVEVAITMDGLELTVVEEWSDFMQDMDGFYESFPKDSKESDDEFFRRKVAMVDQVRELQKKGAKSTYKFRLPFRVDPSQKRVLYIGTNTGCRFCHIDLAERKKLEVESVFMMDRVRNKNNTPKSGKGAVYSKLG